MGNIAPEHSNEKIWLGNNGDGFGWLGHTGELPGYNVTMYYLASKDATMVVMVNSDIAVNNVAPASAVMNTLITIVTPENAPD